ncbi:MAG: LysM peptidoglycan-binding domain-containing protein [Myxococcota bacterium]
MPRTLLLVVAALALGSTAGAATGELLPRPDVLEPNVRFWARIYSEVGGDAGLIHDTVHLDVVYELISLPQGISARAQERRVEKVKKGYRTILRQLARGKRTGLSARQERVLKAWPAGTRNATFLQAASNLRFQLGQADRFRAGLIRSGAWRDHIAEVLDQRGLPPELVALPHVESSYNPRAYSRVGAAGLWQFTRATGRRYLRVDHVVDERLDPKRATVAAARLLEQNHNSLHSWPLAITAYNHGATGMRRAVRKLGTSDIGTIVQRYKSRTFGFASRNFYASFLAAIEIDRHAKRFFGHLERDSPVQTTAIVLDQFYPAISLERALGIDRETLKKHNPSLRPAVWNGSKYLPRSFELQIPVAAALENPMLALESIPRDERFAKQHRDRYYKVRRGDTLSAIADRYRVRIRELMALNNLRSRHRIRAGQVLILPDAARGGPALVAVESLPDDGRYRVRRGDTIGIIARRFSVSEKKIVALNGLRNRNLISVGQQLQLTEPPPIVVASVKLETAPRADAVDSRMPKIATEIAGNGTPAKSVCGENCSALTGSDPENGSDPESAPAAPPPLAEPPLLAEPAPLAGPANNGPPNGTEAPTTAADASLELELLAAVPSNYAVTPDGRITVHAEETLGHYAEWLELRTSRLRALNGMSMNTPVVIGRQARLDFGRVSRETFERRRLEYHQTLQAEFYAAWVIVGTEAHVLETGDTLWLLAKEEFEVPIWLLHLHNPDLDFANLTPGTVMVVPIIGRREGEAPPG